ncbi:MAG: NAD(P)/FAD-dependent oxidoreductase [Ardenticatenaceae bacterium]|nr:NAD(P)/FAD-dependent oxidoreductase [Ardenticatenaceae bacterium]
MRVVNGRPVVIIGSGPAGTSTALHLLRFADEVHLDLNITIFRAITSPSISPVPRWASL